jgi:hypothetical protein
MTHRIVPAEPTDEMLATLGPLDGYSNVAAKYYHAMLSAAPPFVWPEEAVEAAAAAIYGSEMHGSWAWEYQRNNELKNRFRKKATAALNAALKVLEGRDE